MNTHILLEIVQSEEWTVMREKSPSSRLLRSI